MLAPKALKSDKGQNTDRGPDGSSSEFSEDDTPLAVRLNSQGASRLNDAGRQRLRAALSKKGGFVIPRKKKQANGKIFHVTFLKLNMLLGTFRSKRVLYVEVSLRRDCWTQRILS